ncbi:diaminopimelate epimerase [Pelodictyon luteolum]|uniref:Diaminopimelate epimerase n=1 Tax=Chlorobium luteolum (strain DSM 273 / BCRC 81028 / 2530) TaxID=319225 RepID=Q3B1G2_CHLL3|nr:diaminopimelate epimerase [Pelodictyon luteolum]ABB24819.1 diaminopimelate epimerase [Pelodictyon luteolum DSM 273]
MRREIPFSKLSGAGNDFIIMDNRDRSITLEASAIRALCTRRTGIGADGLILIEPSETASFSMLYHNADGLPGTMCGNGGRCAVWFARSIGVQPDAGGCFRFEANGDPYQAWVSGPETVRLRMREPRGIRDEIDLGGQYCAFIDTGSPHAVIRTEGLDAVDVVGEGRAIRHRTDIFPGGTNVNFIEVTATDSIDLRTFERGVEDETLACGTGAVAAALLSRRLGMTSADSIRVRVKSGDMLNVTFSEDMREVYLTGPAVIVYTGVVKAG